MQPKVNYDQDLGVVFVQYGETLNKEIVINVSKEINALPNLPKGTPVFVDFRNCTDINLSSNDTREIAKFMARHTEKRGFFRIAQLVSTQFMFATSRMTTGTIDPEFFEIMIFDNEAEAKLWLGLPSGVKLPF